jgi:hypothetical protein
MRTEVLRDLLAELRGCDAAPEAKADFRKLIEAVGAAHGISLNARPERIAFARQLLSVAGAARPEVRNRLMARFNIGESQAYRDINDALQIVPSSAGIWDPTQV